MSNRQNLNQTLLNLSHLSWLEQQRYFQMKSQTLYLNQNSSYNFKKPEILQKLLNFLNQNRKFTVEILKTQQTLDCIVSCVGYLLTHNDCTMLGPSFASKMNT